MIWRDRSSRGLVVAGCSSCASFRAGPGDPGAVESAVQAHLMQCHDESAAVKRAVTASRARQRRSDTP